MTSFISIESIWPVAGMGSSSDKTIPKWVIDLYSEYYGESKDEEILKQRVLSLNDDILSHMSYSTTRELHYLLFREYERLRTSSNSTTSTAADASHYRFYGKGRNVESVEDAMISGVQLHKVQLEAASAVLALLTSGRFISTSPSDISLLSCIWREIGASKRIKRSGNTPLKEEFNPLYRATIPAPVMDNSLEHGTAMAVGISQFHKGRIIDTLLGRSSDSPSSKSILSRHHLIPLLPWSTHLLMYYLSTSSVIRGDMSSTAFRADTTTPATCGLPGFISEQGKNVRYSSMETPLVRGLAKKSVHLIDDFRRFVGSFSSSSTLQLLTEGKGQIVLGSFPDDVSPFIPLTFSKDFATTHALRQSRNEGEDERALESFFSCMVNFHNEHSLPGPMSGKSFGRLLSRFMTWVEERSDVEGWGSRDTDVIIYTDRTQQGVSMTRRITFGGLY